MKPSWKIWTADLILIGLIGVALTREKPVQSATAKPATPQKTLVTPQEVRAPKALSLPQEVKAALSSDLRVVGYIEKRDRTITIKASSKGPLYSVKTADGKVLFENVSAEQLRAQAPELHDFIKTAVAGNDGKGKGKMDAGMHSLAR
jgi:hypothetical protein